MALFSRKNLNTNPYGLTEKDLIGFLKDFPMGLVVRMLEEQENQGNEPDVTVFQYNNESLSDDGGFDWDETEDGIDFWRPVIRGGDFDSFFKRYPEYARYNLA